MTAPKVTTTPLALQPIVLDGHKVMVGDLVLDLELRTIHGRKRHSVILTDNEFIIMATLVKNAGRFVSKQELLTAVAGTGIEPHISIVDTYIKYLHSQLQEARSAATIEKSTDLGFRLRP
jgi:DNA-binding response OmpR family regulator